MMSVKLPRGSAIRALLWEDWRRSRVAFIMSLGIGMLALLSVWMARTDGYELTGKDVVPLAALSGSIPFILFGFVSLFALGDMREVSTRIPSRHSVLPVGPAHAATLHLTFRVVALALLVITQIVVAQGLVGIFQFYDYMALLGVVLPIFLFVQCLAWTAGNFGIAPFLFCFATIPVGAVVLGEVIVDAVVDLSFQYSPGTLVAIWIGMNVLLSCVAVAGSTLGRHVGSSVSIGVLRKDSRGKLMGAESRAPLSAHSWFEWVERGYLLPSLTLAMTTFAVTYVAVGATLYRDDDRAASFAMALAFAPLLISPGTAALTGIQVLLADRRMAQTGLGAYVYSHPLSTQDFARARLRMSLRSVLLNQLLCLSCFIAGLVGIYAVGGPDLEYLQSLSSDIVVLVCLFAVGHTLLVWTMFWMGVPAIAVWFWYLIVTSVFGYLRIYESHHVGGLVVVPASLLLLTALGFIAKRSTTLGLLDRKLITKSAAVVSVAFLVSVWTGRDIMTLFAAALSGPYWSEIELGRSFLGLLSDATPWFQVTVLIGLIAVALCPAIPILAQPLLVHRLRHR